MSLWSRVRNFIGPGKFQNRRIFQRRLDILKIAIAIRYYEEYQEHAPKLNQDPTYSFDDGSFLDEKRNRLSHKSRRFQERTAYDGISKQLLHLFEHIEKEGPLNPYPPQEKRMDVFIRKNTFENEEIAMTSPTIRKLLEEFEFDEGNEVKHPDGFSLQIRKSQIDHIEAGYGIFVTCLSSGVFVKGSVLPGTVLGIYPGYTQFPVDLKKEFILNNQYMVSRYDGLVIDGREWGVEAGEKMKERTTFEFAVGVKSDIDDDLKKYHNPFAVANYFNHPPPGKQPNVLCVAYNFSKKDKKDASYLPPHLQHYIPHIHRQRRLIYEQGDVHYSLIAVATQHIKDEEVFMNYRFNPQHPYPEWYVQPDLEEAQRRWGKNSLFG